MRSFGTHPTAAHAAWLPVAVGGLQFVTPAFGYTALDGAAALAAVNPLWAGMEVETVVVPDTAPPERQKAGRDDAFVCGEGVRGVVPMVKGGGGQRYLVLYRVVDMKL
ncbi:hypothetical protein I4F81_000107 [Pyropia yezoensis]|uniref:Uncharacterized protein n=1 Tax=Pyropia yezoensis TaxID=2788 RepID=A0ACC3BHY3_PYRYE|nr:hypothetical protein I4F81_000107 [Neopyropia yezoensis]